MLNLAWSEYYKAKIIVFLLLSLTVLSQISQNIIFPSLYGIMMENNFNVSSINLLVSSYMGAYGLSQFFYGPYSDRYGKISILLCGLLVFILGLALTESASSLLEFFVGFFLQGFGMGCVPVTTKAISRDTFSQYSFRLAIIFMNAITLILPFVSFSLGYIIQQKISWKINFDFLLAYTSILLFIICIFFKKIRLPINASNNTCWKSWFLDFFKNIKLLDALKFVVFSTTFTVSYSVYRMYSVFYLQSNFLISSTHAGFLSTIPLLGIPSGLLINLLLVNKKQEKNSMSLGVVLMLSGIIFLVKLILEHSGYLSFMIAAILLLTGNTLIYIYTVTEFLIKNSKYSGSAAAILGGSENIIVVIAMNLLYFSRDSVDKIIPETMILCFLIIILNFILPFIYNSRVFIGKRD